MFKKIKQFFQNKENKRLLKYFAILFLVAVFVFNWRYISFVFNYNVLGEGMDYVADRLNPENTLPILKYNPLVDNIVSSTTSTINNQASSSTDLGNTLVPNNNVQPVVSFDYLNQNHFIEIPKINIKAPIMFTTSTNQARFAALLKKGVLHYPTSALPNSEGAVVILGHSSSPYWPKINYDWIFSDLNKLSEGDNIYIDFDGQRYSYDVVKKYFLSRGAELHPDLTNSKYMVVLISCWPPGGNKQRIVVEAALKK
jgi:LPXTG-site transpeptidase (sortase) family protein